MSQRGEYTLFAPPDDAFAKLDPTTMNRLKTGAAFLNGVLTCHLVKGPLTPAQAGVTCGGIGTTNAQVYMIDTVLIPPNR